MAIEISEQPHREQRPKQRPGHGDKALGPLAMR
jgi:hypothetical protein